MNRIIDIISNIFKKLKIKQRMMIVYIFGCVVPLVGVYMYMYSGTKSALLEQEFSNETARLKEDADRISNSMALAEELSGKFYYDEDENKIVLKQYGETEAVSADYKTFRYLHEYVAQYYPYITAISVYLYEEDHIDNRYFKLITEKIKEKKWFTETVENDTRPYWSYYTDIQTAKKSLRLTRVLFDKEGNMVGVISLVLDRSISEEAITRGDGIKMIVYNEDKIIQSSKDITPGELAFLMTNITNDEYEGWLIFRDSKCLIANYTLKPRYGEAEYHLISIKNYNQITEVARKNAVSGLIPLILGVGIAAISIIMLSNWFSYRINSFKYIMHEASKGNFNVSKKALGGFEDEIWELNNDLNQMIGDIQNLTQTAADERLQKERLYSRQKDVEFKMLATQINPHFLYNTLENIRMLARINKQREIEEISFTLNKLLRRSLNASSEMKPLLWEMEMIEYYIKIQNYRFGERIRAEINYDKELASEYMVIPLVVQPFVENAYVHAMEDMEEGGLITVRAEITDEMVLYVEDNGHGMSKELLYEITKYMNDFEMLDRTHIGICNVNQRIKLKFGDEYGVKFESVENEGTKVTIRMPLINNANKE